MSAQGLLSSVFPCSSQSSKTMTKRSLRPTRSLDPALIRNYGIETDGTSGQADHQTPPYLNSNRGGYLRASNECLSKLDARLTAGTKPGPAASSSLSIYLDSSGHVEYDSKATKRSTAWDLPFLAKSSVTPTGSSSTLFSPRKWLQKKPSPSFIQQSYSVWKYEGDFTWNSMSERSVRLIPVPLQSLSELERVRLQEVALTRLLQDYDLGCQITIPKDGQKRKKSLRRKLDSLAKEKSKDKEFQPQAFGIPLSQVISNDRAHKQRQEAHFQAQREEQRDPSDLVSSLLHLAPRRSTKDKELSSSNSSLSSASETPNESPSPNTPEPAPRSRRRGGLSVDCITDLDDNQSHLLEALQLSLPAETPGNKQKQSDKKHSLNPIYRQVPRVVESCCVHLEKYGLQTVGVFRVGSSKKRVRQLREEYDQGWEIQLDEEHSVHDVAALLKEFLRDMPDPLLTRELYTAFINTMQLDRSDQESSMQLLMYLLPPCNSDTLQRLLEFLAMVAAHADDRQNQDGQEVTGNKMTPLNLATVFGPNLLHKQKSSDKEFAVQSFARAEESTAIIEVVQRMITTQETLFMVPPDLQNEVLISLLETDPDVVDYLLRRKASQSYGPGVSRNRGPISLTERRCSSDSYKASSGEVSPYDNNSPVLSERLLSQAQNDSSPLSDRFFHLQVGQVKGCPSSTCQSADQDTPDDNFWGTWDITLNKGFLDRRILESSYCGSSEGLGCHQGNNSKPPVRRSYTSLGVPECRPHPPVTRSSSSPLAEIGQKQQSQQPLLQHQPQSQSETCSSEDLASRGGVSQNASPSVQDKPGSRVDGWPPLLHPGPFRGTPREYSQSTPTLTMSTPQTRGLTPQSPRQPPQGHSSPRPQTEARTNPSPGPPEGKVSGGPEWQSERWQIWRLLSADNADTLPETLV
ncbi:rho GTPase-activating protein 6 isoform X1 [Esox lucius]|uniref:rho GTPase-activating protein 6 isoform X1 n=2 Tax=Esox lucius TaxID=8010 RepID=UPI0005779F78|nr:rho GTPase-activating protein 6 isoform X1 [Esox lucius]